MPGLSTPEALRLRRMQNRRSGRLLPCRGSLCQRPHTARDWFAVRGIWTVVAGPCCWSCARDVAARYPGQVRVAWSPSSAARARRR